MKTFTYTDKDGRLQHGEIYEIDASHARYEDINKPGVVLAHHFELDMILAFILWLVITITFGAEINLIAWMIGGFVYHIVKNIIKLKKHGTSKMH